MRETYNLGCKEKLSNTSLKTVSAFSNYNGGKIIFGVTDRGECIGLDDAKNKAMSIENKINNSVSSDILVETNSIWRLEQSDVLPLTH